MNETALKIKNKRLIFVIAFIFLTLLYKYVNLQMVDMKMSESIQQYVILAQRVTFVVLYLWFGYSVGINKQTTWFMSMLAVLHPLTPLIGLMVLLFKSGQMQIQAAKGISSKAVEIKGVEDKRESEKDRSGSREFQRKKKNRK